MTICTGFDQTIDTTITIPGAISCDDVAMAKADIRIRKGAEKANGDAPLYTRTDDSLIFSAANVATYRCQPDHIGVAPCPGSDPKWVTALLIATALPAVLWMQGRFVLHAAGIVPEGSNHAIAIVGPSGAGKSFLAAQLLEQGASPLGDDSLALEMTDAGIMASGLPGGIHSRIDQSDERCFESVELERSVISALLGAIIVLDGLADEFGCKTLNKMAALEQIIANQHRPRIPAALNRVGTVLAQATAIAERVPVSVWHRKKGQTGLSALEQKALLESMKRQPLAEE